MRAIVRARAKKRTVLGPHPPAAADLPETPFYALRRLVWRESASGYVRRSDSDPQTSVPERTDQLILWTCAQDARLRREATLSLGRLALTGANSPQTLQRIIDELEQ